MTNCQKIIILISMMYPLLFLVNSETFRFSISENDVYTSEQPTTTTETNVEEFVSEDG